MTAPEILDAEVVPAVTVVPDHATGEVVDLREADDERLVEYIGTGDELVDRVRAHQDHARAELVRRMDRDLSWTRRIGDPKSGLQHELSVPSPDAGTTEYLADELLEVLRALVADDVVSQEAAESAMTRTMTVTVAIPLDEDPEEIAEVLRRSAGDIRVGPTVFRFVKATTEQKALKSRVDKLLKVKATVEAISAIAKEIKPARKLKIKPIEKGA